MAVNSRVEFEIEQLRHRADHARFEGEECLQHAVNADARNFYRSFVDEKKADVALYDRILKLIRKTKRVERQLTW